MPYGLKNETPSQTKWMENCVGSISGTNKRTGKAYTKSEKIAICKTNLKKSGWKPSNESDSELSMREDLWKLEEKLRAALGYPNDIPASYGPYVYDVFDDFIIVEVSGKLFKLYWSIEGDDVTVDWNTAIEVERNVVYEPVAASTITNITNRRMTQGYKTI